MRWWIAQACQQGGGQVGASTGRKLLFLLGRGQVVCFSDRLGRDVRSGAVQTPLRVGWWGTTSIPLLSLLFLVHLGLASG